VNRTGLVWNILRRPTRSAAPTADRPVIEMTSAVSPSSSRTPVIRCPAWVIRVLVSCQSPSTNCTRSSAPARCDHPGRVAERGEQPAHDPQARFLPAAAGDLTPHRLPGPGRPEPPGPREVPQAAADDHLQGGYLRA
jgi:hypothetical protein